MNQIVNQNLVSLTVPLAPDESAFGLTIPILTVPLQIDLNDGIGRCAPRHVNAIAARWAR